jgi:2-dehydropantoate 2-reductase
MNISIIGSGSLGCIYGALLFQAGNKVLLITRKKEHAEKINNHGVTIVRSNTPTTYHIPAQSDFSYIHEADLIIVLTKSYDTTSVANNLKEVIKDTDSTILTLQSGLGNIETLSEACSKERVLGGVSYMGGVRKDDLTILMGENLRTVVGTLIPSRKTELRVKKVIDVFQHATINAEIAHNVLKAIWDKLIIAASQNALGSLTGMTFGQMLNSPFSRPVVENILQELGQIAEKVGIDIGASLVERVFANWQTLPNHRVSMWQDIQSGRRTEIDAINGALMRLGERYGIPTPYNHLISNLIRMKEEHSMKEGI